MKKILISLFLSFILLCGTAFAEDELSFSIDKDSYKPGEAITISYANTGEKDWACIYKKGQKPGSADYTYVGGVYVYTQGTGTATLTVPAGTEGGEYNLFLLKNNGYGIITSIPFTVVTPSISLDKMLYAPGETVTINYANTEKMDWVCIYRGDQSPGSADYTYIGGVYSYAEGEGSTTLKLPDNLEHGKYKVCLLYNNGYSLLDSVSFNVSDITFSTDKKVYNPGEIATLSFSGTGENDWAAVYFKGQTPGSSSYSYTSYAYTRNSGTASLPIISNLPIGEYTVFLLKDNGYEVITSVDITVEPKPTNKSISIDHDTYFIGDSITVNCNNTTEKDWIALYPVNAVPGADGKPALAWTYAPVSETVTRLSVPTGLTTGNYALYLLENDGYRCLDKIDICVAEKKQGIPFAPAGVAYERSKTALSGYADGVVTVTPGSILTDGAVLFWGNENGILEDYSFIGYAHYNSYENKYIYEMTPGNIIPEGANRIYAFGCNGSKMNYIKRAADVSTGSVYCAFTDTPFKPTKLLYSFDVVSDLHVGAYVDPNVAENASNNGRVSIAFKDIAANHASTAGIMVVGDLVNYGYPEEYKNLGDIVNAYIPDFPIYYAVGNHEFYNGDSDSNTTEQNDALFAENWARFRAFANWNENEFYRYEIINGDYFIFLGTEDRQPGIVDTAYGFYSETQRNWLKNLLAEAKKTGANAFVFMHQSIENTISGSYPWQNWDGINDDAEMQSVIESYENTFLFTGHSHWNLNSYMPFINGGLDGANYFNTASAGYLWGDDDSAVPGTEGLRVEVYENYVLVRGREFENRKWIPNVQALIRTDNNYITARRDGDNITVTKNPYRNDNLKVISAFYGGSRFSKADFLENNEFVNNEITFKKADGENIKIFTFEDEISLSPITEVIEIK